MKHVRFSKTKLVHSPDTPATSIGSLTPASSYVPLTPPQVAQGLPGPSPYGLEFKSGYTLPPPPEDRYPASGNILPHPLLKVNSPPTSFDMVEHPSYITYHHAPLPSHLLSESAFSLAIPALTIIIPVAHAHLPPWKTHLSASNGSYLTVHDIFDGIFNALRKNVTPAEFDALLTPEDRDCAVRAYEGRSHRLWLSSGPAAYEEERRRGMKRVDFLFSKTRFAGLAETRYPDSWVLNYE